MHERQTAGTPLRRPQQRSCSILLEYRSALGRILLDNIARAFPRAFDRLVRFTRRVRGKAMSGARLPQARRISYWKRLQELGGCIGG
jgi:hypothetical protein